MRSRVLCVVFLLTSFASLPAAFAQGKDPFRPPDAGAPIAPAPGGPAVGQPAPAPPAQPSGGLARTGQDVGTQLAIGVLLIALGGAILLTERAVVLSPRSG